MKNQHTQGEWKVENWNGVYNTTVLDQEDNMLCETYYGDELRTPAVQAEANAKLMAAAPELLRVLEECKNTLSNCVSELPDSYKKAVKQQIYKCQLAIKKATL